MVKARHTAIASGARIGAVDNFGNTPLHLAARWNSQKVARDIIAAGAQHELLLCFHSSALICIYWDMC